MPKALRPRPRPSPALLSVPCRPRRTHCGAGLPIPRPSNHVEIVVHSCRWTPEEDLLILRLFAAEGRKWGRIAALLPGRSSASVRNRYLRIEKGRQLTAEGKSKNRCAACGQLKLGHVCTASRPLGAVPRTPKLAAVCVPESAPSSWTQASADRMDESAPPLAASVVAVLEPTLAPEMTQSHAEETRQQLPTPPNLACAADGCADEEQARRGSAWMMQGLQQPPILQRLPSSAAA